MKENLILDDFHEKEVLVIKSEYFKIKGHTDSIKNIYVNDKEYFLDENDNFSINVYLFEGVNIFNIRAVKKDNNYIEKEITLIRK